mmetsp:Transcript_1532/g.4012  ORF Transcript_1532/g.4012 Transcript_1532/m.4012 type:complete len:91 (-) Transcript_1532:545-817(-)
MEGPGSGQNQERPRPEFERVQRNVFGIGAGTTNGGGLVLGKDYRRIFERTATVVVVIFLFLFLLMFSSFSSSSFPAPTMDETIRSSLGSW